AWAALESAFVVLGARVPRETARSLGPALLAWGRSIGPRPAAGLTGPERRRLEVLCGMYYQAARLAAGSGRPLRIIESTAYGLEVAKRLGPSAALAKMSLSYSFVLNAFGFRQPGRDYLARAEQIALWTNEPVAIAHYYQAKSAIAAWAGDVQD